MPALPQDSTGNKKGSSSRGEGSAAGGGKDQKCGLLRSHSVQEPEAAQRSEAVWVPVRGPLSVSCDLKSEGIGA